MRIGRVLVETYGTPFAVMEPGVIRPSEKNSEGVNVSVRALWLIAPQALKPWRLAVAHHVWRLVFSSLTALLGLSTAALAGDRAI